MYLHFDGSGGSLVTPSFNMDSITIELLLDSVQPNSNNYVLDARVGLPNGHFNTSGIGNGWTSYFINQVAHPSVDSTAYSDIPKNEKSTLTLETSNAFADDVYFFSSYLPHARSKGNIYKITCKLGGSVVALYDMNTGTVQDQSGNGNHATLNGGTWVDDGGGDTGTTVTYDYDTLERLYAGRTYNNDLTMNLFANRSAQVDMLTRVYESQSIQCDTKTIIHEAVTGLYDTFQEIYSDSIVRTYNYDLSFMIYTDRQTEHDTEQAYYKPITTEQDLKQAIYEAQTTEGDINLIISADRQYDSDTIQQLYGTMNEEYDTRQTFYDEDKALIGKIQLEGKRELNVYLQAKAEKTVNLKGGM